MEEYYLTLREGVAGVNYKVTDYGVAQPQGTSNELTPSIRRLDYFWDATNLGILILEHICVLAAPFYFTWNAFRVFLILSILTEPIGVSLSYHRNLSHKSLKLTKSLEYLFAYFGLHAAVGDPIFWTSIHRYHHQFVDSVKDPHSPIEGFWFSHVNWTFRNTYLWEKKAYYRFLQKTMPLHVVGLELMLYIAGGLPHLIYGM
ncbi:hypothetical protein C5167_008323, partial [Papaver somniferum]